MAKVEMNVGGTDQIDSTLDEYANKALQEGQLSVLVKELIMKRFTMQRKLDAARKRLKRLTERLNSIEEGWRDEKQWVTA